METHSLDKESLLFQLRWVESGHFISYLSQVIEIWILEYPVKAISDRKLDTF
jgi:hypothetical protein